MYRTDPPNPNDLPRLPISSSGEPYMPMRSEVVPDNPVVDHAQKLINKRRDDKHLLTRIALSVMTCLGCAGGFATIGVAFALDRTHFGWVSLIGVASFIVLLWTVLTAAIWLSD
jgi:hypothetical protein